MVTGKNHFPNMIFSIKMSDGTPRETKLSAQRESSGRCHRSRDFKLKIVQNLVAVTAGYPWLQFPLGLLVNPGSLGLQQGAFLEFEFFLLGFSTRLWVNPTEKFVCVCFLIVCAASCFVCVEPKTTTNR